VAHGSVTELRGRCAAADKVSPSTGTADGPDHAGEGLPRGPHLSAQGPADGLRGEIVTCAELRYFGPTRHFPFSFFSFLVSFSQILEFKFKFGWEILFLNLCTIPRPQCG
jgi:hypothetical protein